MGFIRLTNVTLGQPITSAIEVSVYYRLTTMPNLGSNYSFAGTATILPNGNFSTPFIISDLPDGEVYTVRIVPHCGVSIDTNISIQNITTTTTTTTSTTTSTSTTTTTTTIPINQSVILWEFKNKNNAQAILRLFTDGVTPDYVNTNQENTSGSFTVAAGTQIAIKTTYETATSNAYSVQNLTDGTTVIQNAQDAAFWNQLFTTEGGKSYKITVLIDTVSILTDVTFAYNEYNNAQGEGRIFRDGVLLLDQVMTNQAVGSTGTDYVYTMKARVDLLSGNETRIFVKNNTTGAVLYDVLASTAQEFEWPVAPFNRYNVILHVNDTTNQVCTGFTSLQVWTYEGDFPDYDPWGGAQ